jgi:hypothetical protein
MSDRDERDVLVALDQVRGKPRPSALPKLNVCGDIGLRIARDGTWFYQDSPIERKTLVKLFASVLRREGDGSYWLVTPVEKVPIEVEETPFVVVEMWSEGSGESRRLMFRTNVGDVLTADPEHPLDLAGAEAEHKAPRILVRDGLTARLAHHVYYELAGMATQGGAPGVLGVWSAGNFFPFPMSGA